MATATISPEQLAVTLVVAASDSKETWRASWDDTLGKYLICDGTDDDEEIQAALTAAAGGSVILLDGTYVTTSNLTVPANTLLKGQGKATIITPSGASITNGIILNGDNITLKDMKVSFVAGVGTGGSRPNVIYATGRTLLLLENLWVVGDTTVGDDGSTQRQNGVYLVTCTESKIVDGRYEDNKRSGIFLDNQSNENTLSDNTCEGNTSHGILVDYCNDTTISDNTCTSNGGSGIYVTDDDDGATVTGNICNANSAQGIFVEASYNVSVTGNRCADNTYSGIYVYDSCTELAITGNVCEGNGEIGIYVNDTCQHNTITGNICTGNTEYGIGIVSSSDITVTGNTCKGNTENGIDLAISTNCTVSGNTCSYNLEFGIYLINSHSNVVVGNNCTSNSQETDNTFDNIFLQSSDYNLIASNVCRRGAGASKARYGINISDDASDRNCLVGNDLYDSGTTGDLNDAPVTNPTLKHDNRDLAGNAWLAEV